MSHAMVQQEGSIVHTVAQHTAFEHPGVGWTDRHEPIAPGGHWACAAADASAAQSVPQTSGIQGEVRIGASIAYTDARSKRHMKKPPGTGRGA
jgi:hypothetical protein